MAKNESDQPAVPAEPLPLAAPPGVDIQFNTRNRFVAKGKAYKTAGGWIHAPALLEIFKKTQVVLAQIAAMRGLLLGQVKVVRLARIRGEKRIYIIPVSEGDPDAIEIKHYSGKKSINMIEFLADDDLAVPTGYKERYLLQVVTADDGSPVGPALLLDLDKPLERQFVGRKKKKKDKAQPARPEGADKSTAKAGEASAPEQGAESA